MNRKEAVVTSALILASLVGGVFATTTPMAPSSSLTPQTTSVDIEILRYSEANNGLLVLNCGTAGSCSGVQFVNFTAGFSFASAKSFIQVNSVIMTIIYDQVSSSTSSYASTDALSVEVNGRSPVMLGMNILCGSCSTSTSQTIPVQSLKVGANTLNIGIANSGPNTSQAFLFEVRLTADYTFLA